MRDQGVLANEDPTAHPLVGTTVAGAVAGREADRVLLVRGTGIGMAISSCFESSGGEGPRRRDG